LNFIALTVGVLCLLVASPGIAQNSVSLYRLSHKPPKHARRLFDKGSAQLKLHHYQSSAALFREAIAADPEYWDAENNLGYIHLALAQREQAQEAFARATKIDPENPIGYVNLGIAALCNKRYSLAEESARRALRLAPAMCQAKALMGIAEAGEGHWTPAVRKLLEESRGSVRAADSLLNQWPTNESARPELVVKLSAYR
jgi:tetratricopeptide (TPR) repeat protein